jgi:hypothetical protein
MRRNFFVTLAVLIVATAGVYAIFAHDLATARARLVGRSKTVATSFGTLEYAEMGEDEPVLVVHGAEGGFDQGIDMTGALAGRGYRLIAPSRFGYLRLTIASNPTTAMQADAYAQLLDHLGIDKVPLLATRLSAGGVADEWVTQLLRQGDAKVFKKYSQMKLQMKREALQKLDRRANESTLVLVQAG